MSAEGEGVEGVDFTPRQAPTILSRVQYKGQDFDPDTGGVDEKRLSESGVPVEDLERLSNLGVIIGFEPVIEALNSAKPGEDEEGEEEVVLPPVKKLEKWLKTMDDPEKIREIMEQDTRASSSPFYEARLAELE